MKTRQFCLIVAFTFMLMSAFSQVKYDSEKFKDISNVASKIADVNVKHLKKNNVKKVMIVEFYGEYTTSKETSPSAFEKSNSSSYLVKNSKIELGSEYYETLTNMIYAEVKRVFEENGIEVLDKNILINNPNYIELGLKEEKTAKRYTGGVMKQSSSSEVIVRSASGMGMYSNTLRIGAISKINQMIPQMCIDNQCQGAIKVIFNVGLGKKGRPVLGNINAFLSTNISEYNAGRGKVTYAFKNANEPILITKNGISTEADISGTEKGSVDGKKYTQAFSDLVKAMCDAYSYLLKEELKQ